MRGTISGKFKGSRCGIALDGDPVGAFDGSEPGGYSGFAGGDGLAVALAVRAFGEGFAVALNFANVGFAFVGVGGDGEQGSVGGGGVQDEADGLAVGVPLGQGDDAGAVGFWPGLFGDGETFPGAVVEPGEHRVGLVDLVTGRAEVLADRAEVGAAADAVFQELGALGPVGVGAGAGAA